MITILAANSLLYININCSTINELPVTKKIVLIPFHVWPRLDGPNKADVRPTPSLPLVA